MLEVSARVGRVVLYVLRVVADHSPEFVQAWDPDVAGVREVFHARFVGHAYPRHTHDAWTVLLVDEGSVRYALDRRDHGTSRDRVTLLPPHVVHDGRAATTAGFRKRVLYLEPEVVDPTLVGRAVDAPSIADRDLAAAVRVLHDALVRGVPRLEADTRVALVAERLAARLRGAPVPPERIGREAGVADAARDLLDADPGAPPALADLARSLGVSPTHLVRAFTGRFGLPPHAYVVARRVDAARRLLVAGHAPADAAAHAGFYDQSHLTRTFRRHVGTTPGAFVRRAGPGVLGRVLP
jgi:AraC-like DNA-binding protein